MCVCGGGGGGGGGGGLAGCDVVTVDWRVFSEKFGIIIRTEIFFLWSTCMHR